MKILALFVSTAFLTASSVSADVALTKIDQHVLSKIHQGNLTEIEMSKLAEGRSQTNGVKELANDMIQGHGKADIEVKMTAKKEAIKLQEPFVAENDDERQAVKEDHAEIMKLKLLKGAEFDAEYESVMITAHKKTISDLNAILPTTGKHTHALIEKLIPDFQMHLAMINKLQST
jgi:putative membrane protein